MRLVVVPLLAVCLFACPGPSETDGGSGGGGATGGGNATGGGGATSGGGGGTDAGMDAGIDAGLWPVTIAASETVTTMIALDSGDLIVGVRDFFTNEGAVLRVAQDGNVTWRYPLGMRTPALIDVSASDRIVITASTDYVVLNPNGTLRHEVPVMGRPVFAFDRNDVVWGHNFRLDDDGGISMSRIGVETTWLAGNASRFDVEDFFVVLGNNASPPYMPAIRAIELDGGVRWSLPVGLAQPDYTMDVYQTQIRIGMNGAAYVGLASRAGDGGTLTLDVGCGAAGPHSVSAIENGACLWTRSWDPGRVVAMGEVLAFAPTPEGVAVWNASLLEVYDARDGGTRSTLFDGGLLNLAASRATPRIYYFDGTHRLHRAR